MPGIIGLISLFVSEVGNYPSRDRTDISIPYVGIELSHQSCFMSIVNLWNSLDSNFTGILFRKMTSSEIALHIFFIQIGIGLSFIAQYKVL